MLPPYNTHLSVVRSLKNYLLKKQYNNDFIDAIPVITANALGLEINILKEVSGKKPVKYDVVPEDGNLKGSLVLHLKNDHFSAVSVPALRQLHVETRSSDDVVKCVSSDIKAGVLSYSSSELKSFRYSPSSTLSRKVRKHIFRHRIWKPISGWSGVNKENLSYVSLKSPSKGSYEEALKLAMQNCRSVQNKCQIIGECLVDNQVDLLVLTETWLKPTDKCVEAALCPDGYSFIGKPRITDTHGGGVGLVFRSKFSVIPSYIGCRSNFRTFELLSVKIGMKSDFHLIMLYRPPPSRKNKFAESEFLSEIEDLLTELTTLPEKFVLVGDFNIQWNNVSKPVTKKFSLAVQSAGLKQHVLNSTHMNGNIIDLVITRADEALLDNVVVDNWLVSDHLAVCCDLKLPPVSLDFEKIQVRKYKSIHKELFKTDLKHSFRTSDTTQCADDLAVEYNEVLSSLCDKHAPLVNIKSKGKPPKPWYSDIIHLARRKRRRVERRWKKTGLEIHRQMFLQQRESVAKLIDETKQKYYLNVLTGSTMKDMHKTVRELLNTGGKILPVSIPNNALPEEFATYFSNKIAQIRQELAEVSRTECFIDEDLNCPAERLDKFSHVRVSDVNRILNQLAKKSCLLDPCPTWLLHHNKETILPVITKIVNTSLSSGVFPASLKCALITPILKKPGLDSNLLSNYRPVPNLPFIGKVIEKAVAQQVSQHISNYQLWDDLQSAYRPGHSCETAMVKVTNDILLGGSDPDGFNCW